MTKKALSGIRVVDLSQGIAGPYCTKLLAGFGADVIKVERPGTGDRTRCLGPFCRNTEGLEASIPFLWLNTGKKSVTLNLETEKGVELLKRLAADADVLVEDFSPGFMSSRGLSYEALAKTNPGLIMTSISPFGQTGPCSSYQAEEVELSAMSGGMYMTGDPQKAPLAAGPSVYQYTAGQHAYIATLMALFQRGPSGDGRQIDVSIQESGLEHIEITLSYQLQQKKKGKRGGHLFVPWGTYECKDGYAAVLAMPHRRWHRSADLFDEPRLYEKKYAGLRDRMALREEYEEILKPCVRARGKKELFHEGQARGLAFGYVADIDEVFDSPQHSERRFFEEVDHPIAGRSRYCGAPFKMSETPWQTSRAPLLGEHNADVYGKVLGCSDGEIRQLADKGVI